jgi:predicted amidohydrolase
VERASRRHASVVVLPENCLFRGPASGLLRIAAAVTPVVVEKIRCLARETRTAVILGGIPEKSGRPDKVFQTAYTIDEKGRVAARYRKIHLFDVALKTVRVSESRHIAPGDRPTAGKLFGIPTGVAICYDLRFPELFRHLALRGARIVFVPANFTRETGKAHWEVLLRARAIENQIFVVAAGQVGEHPVTGIRSFGTSLVIDPWGRTLARASGDREEILMADLDLRAQEKLRRSFPVLNHIKLRTF